MTLEQTLTSARKALNLATTAHKNDVKKQEITILQERVAELLGERNKAVNMLVELTSVIEKYNIVHTGKETTPLVPSGKKQDTGQEHRAQMPNNEPVENTIRFHAKTEASDMKCELLQYDKVFPLFVKHPVSDEVLLLNGLHNKQ